MTNQMQTARYYKLGFKNNLQLVLTGQGIEWMGTDQELNRYEVELNRTNELIDEKINDEIFDDMAIDAMEDLGLTEDEAERELEDFNK